MRKTDDPTGKRPHSVADHALGEYISHAHDGDADHDHDYLEPDRSPEDNPLWQQDHVSLVSVGMDIGSAGTQIIFSRLNLRRLGEDLSSRYVVVSRETLFQSQVTLTPYQNDERIDDAALDAIIDQAYAAARLHPRDIDTGVVILHRRGVAQAKRTSDCRHPRPGGRGPRLRDRRTSHGGDVGGLRIGCRAGVARHPPANPQHRYRRRNDEARGRGPRNRRRHGRTAYRRPPPGGRRRTRLSDSTRLASITPRRRDWLGVAATPSPASWTWWQRRWPTRSSPRSCSVRFRTSRRTYT